MNRFEHELRWRADCFHLSNKEEFLNFAETFVDTLRSGYEKIEETSVYFKNFRIQNYESCRLKKEIKSRYVNVNNVWLKYVLSKETNFTRLSPANNLKLVKFLSCEKLDQYSFQKIYYVCRFSSEYEIKIGCTFNDRFVQFDYELEFLNLNDADFDVALDYISTDENLKNVVPTAALDVFSFAEVDRESLRTRYFFNYLNPLKSYYGFLELPFKNSIVRSTVTPLENFNFDVDKFSIYYAIKWDGIFGNVWLYFDHFQNCLTLYGKFEDGEIILHSLKNSSTEITKYVNRIYSFGCEKVLKSENDYYVVLLNLISVDNKPINYETWSIQSQNKFLKKVCSFYGKRHSFENVNFTLKAQKFYEYTSSLVDVRSKLDTFVDDLTDGVIFLTIDLKTKDFKYYKTKKINSVELLALELNDSGGERSRFIFLDRNDNVYSLAPNAIARLTHNEIYECKLNENDRFEIERVLKMRSDRFLPNSIDQINKVLKAPTMS